MKIIFFGSPIYTTYIIDQIRRLKYELLAVVTQNEKRGKRGKISKTPVAQYAEKNKLKVFAPTQLNDKKFIQEVQKLNPDLIIIFAYGKILPLNLIKIPKYGCLNIHASILPKWRGAAPIQRTILSGDNKTGITFFKINKELDKGDIVATHEFEISKDDDAISLQLKLSQLAAHHLQEIIKKIIDGSIFTKQDESKSSYANKILKDECIIDWNESAEKIVLKVKAFVGWPVAKALILGSSVRIWSALSIGTDTTHKPVIVVGLDKHGLMISTKKGILCIQKLQLPGKNIITASDLSNSNSSFVALIKKEIK